MSRLKRTDLALIVFSILLSVLGIELAARAYDGKLTTWTNFVRAAYVEMARPKDPGQTYDPNVGWRRKPGHSADGEHVDARGFRFSGPLPASPKGKPILITGDSNTYGVEVNDDETWAYHLQALTGREVLNGGSAGYGFDQAVLRAELDAAIHHPSDIVVNFISHDLIRMEAKRVWGANRPYFDIVDGKAVLRQVPVPLAPDPKRPMPLYKQVLGYSYFIDFMIRRVNRGAPWYEEAIIANPPGTGIKIACLLMPRLRALQVSSGARVLVAAQYDTQAWQSQKTGDEERQANRQVVACAREAGLQALDSYDAIAAWKGPGGPVSLYKYYHMNDAGNRVYARLVAEELARPPLPR